MKLVPKRKPEKIADNAGEYLQITDIDWLSGMADFIWPLCQEDNLKADLARKILYPVYWPDIDNFYREEYSFDALPRERKILRVNRQGTISYIRRQEKIWVIADRYAKDRIERSGHELTDIRKTSVNVWDYKLKYQKEGQKEGVDIKIHQEIIDRLVAEVKSVFWSNHPPARKLFQINGLLMNFSTNHQHATGAGKQLFDLDKKIFRMVREKIMPGYPAAREKFWSVKGKLNMALMKPIVGPFCDPKQLDEKIWKQFYNPYI